MRIMRARHLACVIAVGTALSLGLAGCSPRAAPSPRETIPHFPDSGGQLLSEFVSTVNDIDGLRVEWAVLSELPNIKGNTGFSMRVVLEPGFEVVDPVAFANFLVVGAWSVRDGYQPNTDLTFAIEVDPYDSFHLGDAMYAAGWLASPATNTLSPQASNSARVDLTGDGTQGEANRERLGSWPADPPVPAENMVARP